MNSATTKIVAGIVVDALKKAADKPTNDLTRKDVNDVAQTVTKEVAAGVKHLTNTEDHWWQKRSFWSAIVAIVGVVLGPLLVRYGFEIDEPTKELLIDTMQKGAGALAAYLAFRAGTATKPLGSG